MHLEIASFASDGEIKCLPVLSSSVAESILVAGFRRLCQSDVVRAATKTRGGLELKELFSTAL